MNSNENNRVDSWWPPPSNFSESKTPLNSRFREISQPNSIVVLSKVKHFHSNSNHIISHRTMSGLCSLGNFPPPNHTLAETDVSMSLLTQHWDDKIAHFHRKLLFNTVLETNIKAIIDRKRNRFCLFYCFRLGHRRMRPNCLWASQSVSECVLSCDESSEKKKKK